MRCAGKNTSLNKNYRINHLVVRIGKNKSFESPVAIQSFFQ